MSATEPKNVPAKRWQVLYEMPGGGTRSLKVRANTPDGAEQTVANLGGTIRETREVTE